MLSCHECERYLPVFLDHALEVKESLDVQAHLQSCPSCADRAAHSGPRRMRKRPPKISGSSDGFSSVIPRSFRPS